MTQSTADPGTRLAEEVRLLLDAVADRAGPWLDRLAASSHEDHDRPVACGWCPLCALVSVLRGEPSELAGVVLERAAELVALLRAVLADRWEPGTMHMPGFRPSPSSSPSSPSPPEERYPGDQALRVQKIPVRRAGKAQDED
ncbi:hypothetical protein [Labedaea rhizosphaerae]|uniref:Uncharacterized protein n=1 Tax=Labedaea rhizosphaerae TaxID=598644 RepID=A0A4R6SB16_LABRH|nr:hypothetical protein [Labedaea rhizosphaerae]TDP96065.1 hypothetical protein EV186_10445 [Labedaea rhizosphaerae]